MASPTLLHIYIPSSAHLSTATIPSSTHFSTSILLHIHTIDLLPVTLPVVNPLYFFIVTLQLPVKQTTLPPVKQSPENLSLNPMSKPDPTRPASVEPPPANPNPEKQSVQNFISQEPEIVVSAKS